ncbi:MAG TPA: hypothetical protein VF777_07380 [Phycisphaerales bacterium]
MKTRIASLACAALASTVAAHNHVTVDTASGSVGDKILVKAGYYPTEGAFTISGGRLMKNGLKACYDLPEMFVDGPLAGWFGGDEVLLTSDYFYLTGRLDGGEFRWEIASIVPVIAGSTRVNWGAFDEFGAFSVMAASDGATRLARSFSTPAGDHNHDQAYGFEAGGLYDVTFVAWDASGKFTDADPITIRFRAGPSCPSDIDPDGYVDDADFVVFAAAYNVLDCNDAAMPLDCPADLNVDGFVDDGDFVLFASAYNELLCP